MELILKNKKPEIEVLKSTGINCSEVFSLGENYVLSGDNYIGLKLLLENGFKEKIDLIYIDPPFNTNQIFHVSENRKSTISRKRNGDIAYGDNMEIEEFLEFLRVRLIIMRELLSIQGSIYLHIDCKIGHYVKILMDEIFGSDSFKNDITRIKSNPKNFSRKAWGNQKDLILFYVKKNDKNIWNNVKEIVEQSELEKMYKKKDAEGRFYNTIPLHAPGETNGVTGKSWRNMMPPEGRHWRTDPSEFDKLDNQGLIEWSRTGNPRIKKYADEHLGKKIQDIWVFKDPQNPIYPTEKNSELLDLIIKQSSKEGSYVLDCFAGSGGTMVSANRNNRLFIGMDKSELALDTIRNRLALVRYNFIDLEKLK